jgi:hypothetical protein
MSGTEIDRQLKDNQSACREVFDTEDMKTIGPYKLAAVFIYGGLFGRENTFSYVVDEEGQYWKVVDTRVEGVSDDFFLRVLFRWTMPLKKTGFVTQTSAEAALSDPTGVHISQGGAYMLFYYRTLEGDGDTGTIPEHLRVSFIYQLGLPRIMLIVLGLAGCRPG